MPDVTPGCQVEKHGLVFTLRESGMLVKHLSTALQFIIFNSTFNIYASQGISIFITQVHFVAGTHLYKWGV